MTRGINRERQVREVERGEGWETFRAAGSLGVCDLILTRPIRRLSTGIFPDARLSELRLVEVKASSRRRGAYADFEPEKRRALSAAAERAGATAWLYWWPPHGSLSRIPEREWPGA